MLACQTLIGRGGHSKRNGASEGIRTLDIHVGNVTLYQTELRSLPNCPEKVRETDRFASVVLTTTMALAGMGRPGAAARIGS